MTAGGAVPGAATGEELAAMRAEYERALPWIAAPWDEYFPALFATLDALVGALARAVGGERWAEPVYAPGALVQVASWRCRFCGGRASPQEHIAHTANCPVWILARARGGRDGGE
jgi:hypothetical protein